MQATIHNEYLTLTVDTHGAEAVSLKNAAGEELLWQADPAVWKRHAPILFPWTGKLKDGSFTHGGKTYKGGQHGFARDVEHTLRKAEGDTIRLELRPDETMKAERFPFDFVLTSTFRLDGKTLHHTLTVSNPGSEELRFGIGYHPAFCVPFDAEHTVEDYEFRFDQPESPVILDASVPGAMMLVSYYEKDGRQIPILGLPGCVMYAKNTIFDLLLPRLMADDEITLSEINQLGEGGLCLNCDVCTFPNCGFGK